MRLWSKLVATSILDSTWQNLLLNSRSIHTGSSEKKLCHPFNVPGKLWGALLLDSLCWEKKAETALGGGVSRGRCSLLKNENKRRKMGKADQRPHKLTLLKVVASLKWGYILPAGFERIKG